jgi:ribonuclease-3
MKKIEEFAKKMDITFNDMSVLQEALTHRSYLNENNEKGLKHNERLEFLGDAVLELIITDYLFEKYPKTPEGELTAYRSALVRTESIANASRELGVEPFLRMSKGEARDTGRAREYILANAFEALLGAIYVDQGYEKAKEVIERTLFGKIEEIVEKGSWRDAKSYVQEKAQEMYKVTPHYVVESQVGPDHDKTFTVAIYFGDKKIAEGQGRSKQVAETEAARNALDTENW